MGGCKGCEGFVIEHMKTLKALLLHDSEQPLCPILHTLADDIYLAISKDEVFGDITQLMLGIDALIGAVEDELLRQVDVGQCTGLIPIVPFVEEEHPLGEARTHRDRLRKPLIALTEDHLVRAWETLREDEGLTLTNLLVLHIPRDSCRVCNPLPSSGEMCGI